MKRIFKTGGILIALFAMTLSLQAQKFGYMNSAGILASMPEVKSADATLEVTQKQYQEKGKKMVEEYQMKVQELQKKEQEGTLSPKQIEEEAAKLRAQEETIAKFEQEMNTNLGKKRNELLNPILTRVNEMIQTVAKENGFSFVFDASPGTGILLYADETLDITPLVLAKLGISLPASSN